MSQEKWIDHSRGSDLKGVETNKNNEDIKCIFYLTNQQIKTIPTRFREKRTKLHPNTESERRESNTSKKYIMKMSLQNLLFYKYDYHELF